jgi:hypothetical protein
MHGQRHLRYCKAIDTSGFRHLVRTLKTSTPLTIPAGFWPPPAV